MKKLLIVGASAKEYVLAKKLKDYEVIVAPGNRRISDIVKCVDIREDNVDEILKYVIEEQIDLTVVSSHKAIENDIVSLFQANEQAVFAPTLSSAECTLYRSISKKLLYKLRIPSPHFGVFEKSQAVYDYLKKAPMPQAIYSDSELGDKLVCTTYLTAKNYVDELFSRGEQKIVLEDYVYGHEFTFYVVTDGYHVVPITSVANYKFMENGDGGLFTNGVGAYAPDYKISNEIEDYIMNKVVTPVLNKLQENEKTYLGILGVDCVMTNDNKVVTLGFKNFLSDCDAQAVINLIDEDLVSLFEACINGSFEDYKNIKTKDLASVSCVISSRQKDKVINGLDIVENDITPFDIPQNEYFEYKTIAGKNIVITASAKTLSRARKNLYDDISQINFEGIKFRSDICEQVEKF